MNATYDIKDKKFLVFHYDLEPLIDITTGSLQVVFGYKGSEPVNDLHKIKIQININYGEQEVAVFRIGYSILISSDENDKIQEYIENYVIREITNDSIEKINEIFGIMNIKAFSIPTIEEFEE